MSALGSRYRHWCAVSHICVLRLHVRNLQLGHSVRRDARVVLCRIWRIDGGAVGAIWAFADGFVAGVIIAWVYNLVTK